MTPDFAPEVAKCPQNPQIAFEMLPILCHLAGQSQCHTQPVRHHYNVGFKHSLSNKIVLLRCYMGGAEFAGLENGGPSFSRSCSFQVLHFQSPRYMTNFCMEVFNCEISVIARLFLS